MDLINIDDLTMGSKGIFPRTIASLLMSIFGINNINKLYAGTYNSGDRCAEHMLSILNTRCVVEDKDLTNIPDTGGVIIISNHPTGGLDGVLLIDLLSKIRPDIKFMGNFILQRIHSLSKYFIPVNPYDRRDPLKNIRGVRSACEHVESGGALMVFPAGEVSEWNKAEKRITDRKWNPSMVKMIHKCAVPVVPLFIKALNSRKFYTLASIHPLLKMALLPREFSNKRHMKVPIFIGEPVPVEKLSELGWKRSGDYLRELIYQLQLTPKARPENGNI